jgi:hypothetical protein
MGFAVQGHLKPRRLEGLSSGVGRLPVVARGDPAALLGVVSHSDVLAAYQRAVPKRSPRPQDAWRPQGVSP